MSKFSFNDVFLHQSKRLLPVFGKRGVITAIHTGLATVDLYFSENPQSTIRNVSVSSAVDLTKAQVGDKCKVDIFNENNVFDMVVAYLYGRKF